MGSVLTIQSSASCCGDPGVSTSAGFEITLRKILIKVSRPVGWRSQGPPGVGASVGTGVDGVADGLSVGVKDGEIVGVDEGVAVGPLEGTAVGPSDGATEGLSVGDGVAPISEGGAEGLLDGELVGVSEGELVGTALGAALSKLLICVKTPSKNARKSASSTSASIFFSSLFSVSTGLLERIPFPNFCLLMMPCLLKPRAEQPFGAMKAAAARERASLLCFMVILS